MSSFYLFSLRGIPVHVSPWFVLIMVYFGWRNGDPIYAVMFALAAFFSLLVHELGHALTADHYRLQPAILLHGLGGLTQHRPAPTRKADILVTAAGPAAGLSLAAVCVLAMFAAQAWAPELLATSRVGEFLMLMVYINVFWNVLNLVPLLPLDGGKLFEHLVRRILKRKPATASRVVHGVGVAIAGIGVAWGATSGFWFVLLLSLYFGYMNLTALRDVVSTGPSKQAREATTGVLADAEKALAAGNPREAARLAHLARSEPGLSDAHQDRARAIIVIGSSQSGQHGDAVRFFRLAPKTPETVRAALESMLAEGDAVEARAVLVAHGGALPRAERDALERRVAAYDG